MANFATQGFEATVLQVQTFLRQLKGENTYVSDTSLHPAAIAILPLWWGNHTIFGTLLIRRLIEAEPARVIIKNAPTDLFEVGLLSP
jgi:hypothetical protein